MKNVTKIAGIIAMVAVIGFGFVSCDSPEEKAAKAAQKAADDLLTTLGGTDTAAIQEALTAAGSAGLAALTSTSGAPGGDFSYDLNEAGDGIVITRYSGNGGLVVVPAEIEGYPVVSVDGFNGGFEFHIGGLSQYAESNGGERITAVVLPDSIITIGAGAFGGCTNLHTINIPAGIQTIEDWAFYGCENLYNLTISEGVSAIKWAPGYSWSYIFKGCGKLPLATRQRLKDLGYSDDF